MFKSLPLLVLSAAVSVQAAAPVVNTFATGGTGTTTLSYAVASANYGMPRLQYINATSDKATSVIQFYTAAAPVRVTAVAASGQAVFNFPTTGVNTNTVVLVRSLATDTYQRCSASIVTSTNITAAANLSFALAVGDPVYIMTTSGKIPVGAATKEVNAASGAVWNGQIGRPLLIEVDGTSACFLNAASGTFTLSNVSN